MSYVKVNVAKPAANMGVGGNKKDKLTIFDWEDVLTPPSRDESGVVSTSDIVFKEGAYAITIYATQHTIEAGHKLEGDPDKKGYIQSVKFEHPGDSVAITEFDANWSNRNVGILIERCSSSRKKLYGSPCAPLQMVSDAKDNKDTNHTEFTFTSAQKGPIPCEYQGAITLDSVKDTVAADATTVDVAEGPGDYQLSNGTSAAATITGLTNAVEGASYRLLGSGGSHPSTITGGSFLLASGAAWTAISGATLTVKAIKDGVSTYKFLEISRT